MSERTCPRRPVDARSAAGAGEGGAGGREPGFVAAGGVEGGLEGEGGLVDVAGERVLLGVAAGRIERLHVLPPGAAAEIDAPVAPAPSFPGVLAAVLGRRDAS